MKGKLVTGVILASLALSANVATAAGSCPTPGSTYEGYVQPIFPNTPLFAASSLTHISKLSGSNYEGKLFYFSPYIGSPINVDFHFTCSSTGNLHSNSTLPLPNLNAKVTSLSGELMSPKNSDGQYTIEMHGWAATPSNPQDFVTRVQLEKKQ